MSRGDDTHYANLWGSILSEELPCGEDVSFEPDFDRIQTEVAKDTSLHGNIKTDWTVVLSLANSLLAKSKNLWAVVYGVIALQAAYGLPQTITAVEAMTGLVRDHWDFLSKIKYINLYSS